MSLSPNMLVEVEVEMILTLPVFRIFERSFALG